MTHNIHVAEKLLEVSAVQLNVAQPFTWASGWKSPIYCDNRRLLSFPFVRDYIKSELANLVFEEFASAEVIAGVATAGIPWGAMVADQLKLPFVYVRPKPKEHGLGNQIEGIVAAGQRVAVVEDLVSTGKSSLAVVHALRAAGCEIVGMAAIFQYGFPHASGAFDAANLPLYTLTDYKSLTHVAVEKGFVKEAELGVLLKWAENPAGWRQDV